MSFTAADVDRIISDALDDAFDKISDKADRAGLSDQETLALIVDPDIREQYADWIEGGL